MAKPASLKRLRDQLRDLDAGRRRIARPDDGDLRHGQHVGIAADRNQRRRIVDHLQPVRIRRFTGGDDQYAEFFRRLDLALSLRARTDFRRSGAAAAGETGQGVER